MSRRRHTWLMLELGEGSNDKRVRYPYFVALHVTPQFVRRARRLVRLALMHQLDNITTSSLETQLLWGVDEGDEQFGQQMSEMHLVCGEYFIFELKCHRDPPESNVIEPIGSTFLTTLDELEEYCVHPSRIHFIEVFDGDGNWRAPEGESFITRTLKRMLKSDTWAGYQREIQELLRQ